MNTPQMDCTDQFASEGYFSGHLEWPVIRPVSEAVRLPSIIRRPELQNLLQRSGSGMITMLAWAIWVYLFLPALEVIGRLFGYSQFPFGGRFPLSPSTDQTILTLIVYALLVAIAGGLLMAWATYNLLRFRQQKRRRGVTRMKIQELVNVSHTNLNMLGRLQSSRIAWLDHNEHGEIVGVRPPLTERPAAHISRLEKCDDRPRWSLGNQDSTSHIGLGLRSVTRAKPLAQPAAASK